MDFVEQLCLPVNEGVRVHHTDLVPVHKLLADDVLTDAGGRYQVVELVEELYAALMVLRCSLTQLVPQDQSYTLSKRLQIKKVQVNRIMMNNH